MQAAADSLGFRLIGHRNLNVGGAMQVIKHGDFVYVAHVGVSPLALSILDCSDPTSPRLVRQIEHLPNTHSHKVQIVGNVMIQNCEEPYVGEPSADPPPTTGLAVYNLDEARLPARAQARRSRRRPYQSTLNGNLGLHHIVSNDSGAMYVASHV